MQSVELSKVHRVLADTFADWQDAIVRVVDEETLTVAIDDAVVKLDHLRQLADLEVGSSLRISLRWSLVSVAGTEVLVLPFGPSLLPEDSLEWHPAERAGLLYAAFLQEADIKWDGQPSLPRFVFEDEVERQVFQRSARNFFFDGLDGQAEGPLDAPTVGPLVMEESDNGWALVSAVELEEFAARELVARKLERCRCLGEVRDVWNEVQQDEFLSELVLDTFEESDLAPHSSTPADTDFLFVIADCESFIPRPMWLEMATLDTLSLLPDEPPFSEWEREPDVAAFIPPELVLPTLDALRELGHEVEVRGRLPEA